jgi:hypothetical protein
MRYRPFASERPLRETPVATFVAMTSTPGTTAFVVSITVPVISPEVTWAHEALECNQIIALASSIQQVGIRDLSITRLFHGDPRLANLLETTVPALARPHPHRVGTLCPPLSARRLITGNRSGVSVSPTLHSPVRKHGWNGWELASCLGWRLALYFFAKWYNREGARP